VIRGIVTIYYVDSEENIADIGTKPLAKPAHDYLMLKFMSKVEETKVAGDKTKNAFPDEGLAAGNKRFKGK
jgi:hypothetical protein